MKKIILLLLCVFSTVLLYSQYRTVSMSASDNNATAFGTSGTIGTNGATYYVHWDNDYLYLGWSGGNTNYSSDMYYAAIDTDPNTDNGVSAAFNNVGFTSGSGVRKPDYLMFYENNSSFHGSPATNGNAFERWGNSGGAWAFLSRTGGDDASSSQIVFSASGEVRLRVAWSDLGNPTRGTDRPIAITMWTNNADANFMWGRFPTENPGTGATPKTLTHSFIFYNTGDGVNPSTSFVVENNTFTASDISGTQTLGITISGNRSLTGATSFNSNLNILPSSSLSIGSNTLTLASTITGSGTLVGSSSSNVTMNGSGAVGTLNFSQTSDGTSNLLNNLTLNRPSSGSVTLGNKLIIANTLTLSDGTLTTGGNLHLRSNASGTARIAQITGTGSISGNLTVQRFIPAKSARKWSFLSSPVTQSIRNSWQSQVFITGTGTGGAICGAGTGNGGGTDRYNSNGFDVIGTSAASLFRYNATQVSGSRWVSVANTSGNLTPGTGYRINIRGPRGASDANCADQLNNVTPPTPTEVTLSVTGSYSSTPTASIFGTTSTGGSPAWSLIGNPYPSEISLQAVKAANSNISTSFYFYSAQNGANIYSTYNSGTNQAANFPTGYTNGSGVSDVIVASGQAFFVSTTDASDGTVNFAESHKSSTATPGNNFYSRTLAITDKVRMGFFDVTNNIAVNDIFLNYLNESGASNTVVTEFDSYTFNSGTNLSSIKSGKKMVIQSRAAFTADDIVLLSVPAAVGAYRFDFSEYDQFTTAAQIVLRDKFLNIEQDVKVNNSYSFNVTADAASQGDNRFELVFKTATTLPVNFLGITAVKKNGAVEVSWTVAQETNLSGYQVERSTTGSNFSTIATVTATGANKYNTVDNSNVSGTVYYRIKTIERSGTGKYSAVVKLNLNSKGETVSVYPNPVREQVQLLIANGNNGLYSVRIITAAGKEVWQQSGLRANGQTMTIATHQLAAGNYLLALTNANGETTVAKFVKQ